MKTLKDLLTAVAILILSSLLIWWNSQRPRETLRIEHIYDTVVIRDTLHYPEPVPVRQYVTRVDTVWLTTPGDTVRVQVEVPLERKEYVTEDYRAVVEGFRPSLASMELYRPVKYITATEIRTVKKRPRFGVGVQTGVGYAGELRPYFGIGVQYNIWTF